MGYDAVTCLERKVHETMDIESKADGQHQSSRDKLRPLSIMSMMLKRGS